MRRRDLINLIAGSVAAWPLAAQRVTDIEANEVIALETTWKKRFHTRWPEGLNDN
jgi:hypothetical protein